ncbi:MAG: ATP synthase F1 subunit epsilon [Patescibacteria group bacterium]
MKIQFRIITLEKTVYQDEVDSVTLPTKDGEITVLSRHTPLVSMIEPGQVMVRKDGAELLLSVSSGFLEVRPNSEVIILADSAERAEEIDIERAEAARARVEEMLKEKENLDDVAFARMQAQLEKELARVKVGKKYKRL